MTSSDPARLALALIGSPFSVSPKRLVAPGPDAETLARCVEAAGCAPDHELLRPWRLVRIAPDQRQRLGALFVDALLRRDPAAGATEQARARDKAFNAPELLLAVIRLQPIHDNVPESERYVALGAGLMALLLAAHGHGFAAMLTSGKALREEDFARAFQLDPGERPVCFVSLGTATEVRRRQRPPASALLSDWQPPP